MIILKACFLVLLDFLCICVAMFVAIACLLPMIFPIVFSSDFCFSDSKLIDTVSPTIIGFWFLIAVLLYMYKVREKIKDLSKATQNKEAKRIKIKE